MEFSMKPFVLSVTIMLLLGGSPQVWAQGRSARIDPAFNAFWIKFKAAVAGRDKRGGAALTKLPFMPGGQDPPRGGFINQERSRVYPRGPRGRVTPTTT